MKSIEKENISKFKKMTFTTNDQHAPRKQIVFRVGKKPFLNNTRAIGIALIMYVAVVLLSSCSVQTSQKPDGHSDPMNSNSISDSLSSKTEFEKSLTQISHKEVSRHTTDCLTDTDSDGDKMEAYSSHDSNHMMTMPKEHQNHGHPNDHSKKGPQSNKTATLKLVCVKICHIPPGNPNQRKEMVIPITAIWAHLNHGGKHKHHDHIGGCSQTPESILNEEPETDSTTDTGSGSNSGAISDDLSAETEPTVQSELPLWCLENIERDADCDGIIDSTGEPIF